MKLFTTSFRFFLTTLRQGKQERGKWDSPWSWNFFGPRFFIVWSFLTIFNPFLSLRALNYDFQKGPKQNRPTSSKMGLVFPTMIVISYTATSTWLSLSEGYHFISRAFSPILELLWTRNTKFFPKFMLRFLLRILIIIIFQLYL